MNETARSELPKQISVLGAGIEIGASQRGTLMGPAALRTAGLLTLLEGLGFAVNDHGDFSVAGVADLDDALPDNAKHYREIQRWIGALSARAYEIVHSGAIPIFIGGDHSLSMGSVNGVARHCREIGRELFVMWLDAHADYNTPATTITGNMHGMSAAFLCGEPGLDGLLGKEPRTSIDSSRLELFGTRSIDKLEKDLLRHRRISVADMRQIDEFGVGVLIRRVIDRVKASHGVLHLSFDVDFLDPSVAPGVGTTVPGGATYREAHLVMEMLHDSGLVQSVDIVELNPFLDERGRTARTVVELIGSLFGERITDRPTPTNAIGPDSLTGTRSRNHRRRG
ncbi:MAG TPA: arginase [Bradyrhizobium sp.]|nr:arginase [Bradyrhizobium sp.]